MSRALPFIAGAAATLNVAATVLHILDRDWINATITLALAAALTTLTILELRKRPQPELVPAPVDPERGVEFIVFDGGPLDGAEILAPAPGLEQLLANAGTVDIRGTTYRVNSVHHTAYNATAEMTR